MPAHADPGREVREREEAAESAQLRNAAAVFSDEKGLQSNIASRVGDATTHHERWRPSSPTAPLGRT